MSLLEVFGFVTGALCVWLLVRQNIWNWPLGLANNGLFIALSHRSGLYADVGLQFRYIAIGLYGWWHWLHGDQDQGALTVSRTPPRWGLGLAAGVIAATAGISWVLRRYTRPNFRNEAEGVLHSCSTLVPLSSRARMRPPPCSSMLQPAGNSSRRASWR